MPTFTYRSSSYLFYDLYVSVYVGYTGTFKYILGDVLTIPNA